MPAETRHTLVVALEVTDPQGYARYREGMTPILEGYGGRFDWDLQGGEVLRSPDGVHVNRVFALSFPDRARRTAFFSDPKYREVRDQWFDPAVAAVFTVAESADP